MAMSIDVPSDHPLLNKLIETESRDTYIQYITLLNPGVDRYLIGGESIEIAKQYTFAPSYNNAERVLICFAAFMHYQKTKKWENPQVGGSARTNGILFRGYRTNGQIRAEISSSELLLLFDEIWLHHHPNQAHIMRPLQIINDTVLFNLDIEYETHATNALDSDQFRSLRFIDGGEEIASRGYYEKEIPIKNVNGIQFRIHGKYLDLFAEDGMDFALRITTSSYSFDVSIDEEDILVLGDGILEIDNVIVCGKDQRAYNLIVNGAFADIQIIDKNGLRALSQRKRVQFIWRHYEIKALTESTYYSHPRHTSQKLGVIVECFGREFNQIKLSMESIDNSLPSYRLKLLSINQDEYTFETNREIFAGQYKLTILSQNNEKISETKTAIIDSQ